MSLPKVYLERSRDFKLSPRIRPQNPLRPGVQEKGIRLVTGKTTKCITLKFI